MKVKDIIYEQILMEVNPRDIIFSHRGRAVVDTTHATEQFIKRIPTFNPTEFFKLMIDRILKIEEVRDVPEEMLVYSKKFNQALIVAYRFDKFDRRDLNKNFYIMTYLPPGKKNPRPGTFSVMVEHESSYIDKMSPELMNYLSQIVNSRRTKLNENTTQYDYLPVSLVNGLDHKIILSNNKLWDITIPVIEF